MEAYVNHVFNTSVEGVFEEFKRGFFQVCDRDLVKLFRPKELQEVLVGKDLLDWAKLKQVQSETRSLCSPFLSEALSDIYLLMSFIWTHMIITVYQTCNCNNLFHCFQNTVYEGGYHPDHPTIQMFWEVFDELNEDQKKAFLCKYLTWF